jgi:histidinol-phosphate aminotransferase
MKTWLNKIKRFPILPRPTGIDLRYSEWIAPLPPHLFRKFKDTLKWDDFALYPDTNFLKNRIAAHHMLSADNIYLGPGSSECIRNIFECFSERQSITTTLPCFPMYDVNAEQNNLFVNKISPTKELKYKAEDIKGGNLIIISRPSSPVGYFFTREDVITILNNNLDRCVLIDEAYIDYVEDKDNIIDLISEYKNLIISRSFSKVFGAAGCRVGYLISNADILKTVSSLRPMYEISGPSQKYAMFLLDNKEEVENYCEDTIIERKKLCELFLSKNIPVVSSEGNWIHVQQSDVLLNIFKENNIHCRMNTTLPHSDSKWLRITVGPTLLRLFEKIIH